MANPQRAHKLEQLYLMHIFDCLDYAEAASQAVFAEQIPQIMVSRILSKKLPPGPDRSSYKYFQSFWEKKIKAL